IGPTGMIPVRRIGMITLTSPVLVVLRALRMLIRMFLSLSLRGLHCCLLQYGTLLLVLALESRRMLMSVIPSLLLSPRRSLSLLVRRRRIRRGSRSLRRMKVRAVAVMMMTVL
ncbi:hypothetical protein FOZ62_019058, partial [Perkinsus olseni]